MMKFLLSLIKLTRLREYYGTVIIVTFIGVFLVHPASLLQVFILLVANLLSTAFAFMFNDVEDAKDDALDMKKKLRNPISAGEISRRNAAIITSVVGLVSLYIYYVLGLQIFFLGLLGVFLGFLYSYKRVRLKSIPIADLASHGYFLGSMYFLTAIFTGNILPPIYLVIVIALCIFLASLLSNINNQIRDYDVDRKVGIRNSTNVANLARFETGFYLMWCAAASVIFVTILFYSTTIVRLIILSIVAFMSVHFYLNRLDYKNNLYNYPYQQQMLTLIGLVLMLPA